MSVQINEVTAPSRKSNSTVNRWLGVERTKGYYVLVHMKDRNLDYSIDSRVRVN